MPQISPIFSACSRYHKGSGGGGASQLSCEVALQGSTLKGVCVVGDEANEALQRQTKARPPPQFCPVPSTPPLPPGDFGLPRITAQNHGMPDHDSPGLPTGLLGCGQAAHSPTTLGWCRGVDVDIRNFPQFLHLFCNFCRSPLFE